MSLLLARRLVGRAMSRMERCRYKGIVVSKTSGAKCWAVGSQQSRGRRGEVDGLCRAWGAARTEHAGCEASLQCCGRERGMN